MPLTPKQKQEAVDALKASAAKNTAAAREQMDKERAIDALAYSLITARLAERTAARREGRDIPPALGLSDARDLAEAKLSEEQKPAPEAKKTKPAAPAADPAPAAQPEAK